MGGGRRTPAGCRGRGALAGPLGMGRSDLYPDGHQSGGGGGNRASGNVPTAIWAPDGFSRERGSPGGRGDACKGGVRETAPGRARCPDSPGGGTASACAVCSSRTSRSLEHHCTHVSSETSGLCCLGRKRGGPDRFSSPVGIPVPLAVAARGSTKAVYTKEAAFSHLAAPVGKGS